MAAGLIAVWFMDLRSRQVRHLLVFAEAVRNIRILYDGLVVPGALLLLGSGIWMVISVYGGWALLRVPWLAGMVALFAFEFVEGNTVTRFYFVQLDRLSKNALRQGVVTSELEKARRHHLPTFTHFLDLPILFVIVALRATRAYTWGLFIVGMFLAVTIATILTLVIPRMYPFAVDSAEF